MKINYLSDFIEIFDQQTDAASELCFLVRGDELQKEAIYDLERLKIICLLLQRHYIADEDEDNANKLLACKSIINAIQYELRMYICLKQNQINEAWNRLIDAREFITVAIKSHDIYEQNAQTYLDYLETLEKIIFPPQIFLSSATIIRSRKCSICEMEYDDCEHLMGKAYMGRMCSVRIDKCDFKEGHIVEIPADKHCRAFVFKGRDTMTGRINESSFKDGKLKADFEGMGLYFQ
jgi:hypothetical protein